jgi:hypothetical protein
LHIPRAFTGTFLVIRLPNTHDMISKIDIPQNEKIPIEKIGPYIVRSVNKEIEKYSRENKRFLIAYIIFSALA